MKIYKYYYIYYITFIIVGYFNADCTSVQCDTDIALLTCNAMNNCVCTVPYTWIASNSTCECELPYIKDSFGNCGMKKL